MLAQFETDAPSQPGSWGDVVGTLDGIVRRCRQLERILEASMVGALMRPVYSVCCGLILSLVRQRVYFSCFVTMTCGVLNVWADRLHGGDHRSSDLPCARLKRQLFAGEGGGAIA